MNFHQFKKKHQLSTKSRLKEIKENKYYISYAKHIMMKFKIRATI